MNEDTKRSLGKGLAVLLGEQRHLMNESSGSQEPWLDLTQLAPSPLQPRKVFNEQALEQLASSIESQGILQPLLVRPLAQGRYEIVAGERRWRAAQRTSLTQVPVRIVNYTDQQVMEAALIENIQRENLNPIEEAESYKRLLQEHQYTQETLSKVVGKSRSHIANMLRLLTLPPKIQDLIMQGVISMGHARALLSLEDPEDMVNEILQKGLSVRQVERMTSRPRKNNTEEALDPDEIEEKKRLELQIQNLLGLKVSLHFKGDGGALHIDFQNFQELDFLIDRWNQLPSLDDAQLSLSA